MRKIIIAIALCASFAMAAWDGTSVQPQQSTKNGKRYYLISTPQELAWFAEYVNDGNTDANALLTKNIVVNGTATSSSLSWTPIGSDESNAFDGIFDGDNFTIQGIYSSGKIAGLFGYIGANGTVSNLKITSSLIVAGNSGNGGAVAAINQGTITNCVVEATLSEAKTKVYDIFKDYLYYAYSISFRDFNDRMNASGPATLGGIAGTSSGNISYCEFKGENDDAVFSMGGIVGDMEGGTISHCVNRANITVKGDFDGAIEDNRSTGSVSVSYSMMYFAGGIAAEVSGMSASIDNSINYGNVTIDNQASFSAMSGYVGGIVGHGPRGTVSRSVNKGNVTILMSAVDGVILTYAGGISGYADDSLTNNANWGNVIANKQPEFPNSYCQSYVGGITTETKEVYNSFSAALEVSSDCKWKNVYATIVSSSTRDMCLYYNNEGEYGQKSGSVGKPLSFFTSRAIVDTLNANAPSVWRYSDGAVSPVEPGKEALSSSSRSYSSSSKGISSSSKKGSSSSSRKRTDSFISATIPQYSVYTESRRIYVSGVSIGSLYAVFDMQGRVIVKGSVSATNIAVPVPRLGNYVLLVGDAKRIVSVK